MAINLPIISKFDPKGINQAESSLTKLGRVAAGVAAAATTAVVGIATASVKAFAGFDSKLNQSIAIMGDVSDAMRSDMADAAREVAKETTFSAEQAAESFFFLASAGLDAASSIQAMPQVAKFAQAGMFDMALATDLLTDAQSALGMVIKNDANANLEEMTRLSDVLVRANTLANASVEQFSTALTTKAGASLRQFGKDAEEGVAVLAALADQGIKGEIAGTNLSIAIRDLTSKALANEEAFAAAGVAVFDSSGEMRNMADIIADLENATAGMSDAQTKATFTTLGFSDKSMGTLAALMGTSEAIRTYEAELRSASGFTDDVAGKQLETFSAQLELLKSRVADVGIGIGAVLVPALLTTTDSLGPMIEALGPQLIAAFEALIPAVTMVLGVLPKLLPILTKLIEVAVAIVEPLFEIAANLFPLLEEVIKSVIDPLAEFAIVVANVLSDLIRPLVPALIALVAAFAPLIAAILPVLVELIQALLPIMTILLNDLFIPLIPVVVGLITALMPLLTQVLPVLAQIIKEAVIPAMQVMASIAEYALVNAVTFLSTHLGNFISFMGTFAQTFKDIWDGIYGFVKGIINGILGFIQGMINGVVDGMNTVIRALNKIKVTIPDWVPVFGGKSFGINLPLASKATIPQLADGGIVMPQPGGVLANLAEAGKPEAVIPLDRLDMAGKSVTYNVTVNAGMGADGNRIGQLIVDEIRRFERANGPVFASA